MLNFRRPSGDPQTQGRQSPRGCGANQGRRKLLSFVLSIDSFYCLDYSTTDWNNTRETRSDGSIQCHPSCKN